MYLKWELHDLYHEMQNITLRQLRGIRSTSDAGHKGYQKGNTGRSARRDSLNRLGRSGYNLARRAVSYDGQSRHASAHQDVAVPEEQRLSKVRLCEAPTS